MIISDLQYIESVNETEAQATGGGKYFNQAGATGVAEAFGRNTKAFAYTHTLTIEGNYSGAGSESYSESY
ncbi:MAG: hypothetical protein RLZZ535_1165 [Cyanobacteriota bacterium]|jgi:hypothetical protein